MSTEHNISEPIGSNAAPNTATTKQPDRTVSLRFKHSEWIIIAGDIADANVSINAYFRLLALDAPVPRKARRRGGGEQAKIYAQFLGELNKIGSNINQLTRQANTAVKIGDAALMPHDESFLEALLAFADIADDLRAALKEYAASSPQPGPDNAVQEADDDH